MGDQSTARRTRQSITRALWHLRYVAQNTREMIADLAEFERQLGLSIEQLELAEERMNWTDDNLVEPAAGTSEPARGSIRPTPVDGLMTQVEVAKVLSVSRTTLWKMRKQGRLPPQIRISDRRVAYRRADVENWIEQGGSTASKL